MAAIWDDRLAEVWAAPGRAGAGVVVGTAAVLTARHVVADALDGGKILSRVVKPGAATAAWVPMEVLAEDRDWDMALLGVDNWKKEGDSRLEWLPPSSSSPVFVRLGTSAAHDCAAVGFPQSEVQRAPAGDPVTTVRQSEQAIGTLLPAGQAKRPVNPERSLPKRWIPLDAEQSTPGTQAGWGGMSGAGVVLGDGRLAGFVVAAESGHQERRLYVVPFADVLTDSHPITGSLAAVLGAPAVIEVKDAPLHRLILQDSCLAPDGMPISVGEAGYKAFGVKPAGLPDEPAFLNYVPRDVDQDLHDGLQAAQAERRMLLVVGHSAGGKSRSAAEAAQLHLPGHRLLCPRPAALARMRELPVADFGPALAWLDDAERYEEQAFRDDLQWLLRSGVVVVATIRRTELEARMPKGDLRNPLGEALTDADLTATVPWPVIWNDQERARVSEHAHNPALLAWVASGRSPSVWIVAGPPLESRLRNAEADDGRPARYAIVRTALDWYRTGIARPMPLAVIPDIVRARLQPYEATAPEIEDALQWGFESVTGVARLSQSLLTKTPANDAIAVHDYIQDVDARAGRKVEADAVWMAALKEATSDAARFAVGYAAAMQANTGVAREAWLLLVMKGDGRAMFNLGVLLADSDPAAARRWHTMAALLGGTGAKADVGAMLEDSDPGQTRRFYEKAAESGWAGAMGYLADFLADSDPEEARSWYEMAAEAGHTGAINYLGALLKDSDPGQARRWFERAAEAGDVAAMNNLGVLFSSRGPIEARRWYEKAAEAGHTGAMFNLGLLLADSDPGEARRWYEKAAEAGWTDAMNNLGALLASSDPGEARRWYEKAAEAGDVTAMNNLGALLANSDRGEARRWFAKAAEAGHMGAMNTLEKVAEAGDTDAMFNLGALLADSDPGEARRWFERAARAGHVAAMFNLGLQLKQSDPDQARRWYERAAEAGHTGAMNNLGLLFVTSDPGEARRWFEKAAEAGHVAAMFNLGLQLKQSDPDQARRWYERAAEAGHTDAMFNLGALLADSDPEEARRWFEKAAEAGHPDAMNYLGILHADSDPEEARPWFEKAAEAGHPGAMANLGLLLKQSDPDQARRWYERAAEAGHSGAMFDLGMLLEDSDPREARRWYKRAAEAGHPDATNSLGKLRAMKRSRFFPHLASRVRMARRDHAG